MSKFKSQSTTEGDNQSWTKVLLDIIIKVLTLGFYHLEKHKKQ